MLLHQLKTTLRSLFKSKSYLLLNVFGLAPGLLLFMLMAVYVLDEFSYDRYHERVDRLYRVYKEDIGNDYQGSNRYAVIPTPLVPTMRDEYPEVEQVARVDYNPNTVVRAGEEVHLESMIHLADPEIFELLSLNLLVGNADEVLRGPDAAVVSESVALKYFGRTDVLGETISFRDEYPAKITGVIADMPRNSHFVMDVIFNFEGVIKGHMGRRMNRWNNSSYYGFILLAEGADAQALEAKLPELRAKYADDPIDEDGQESIYHLQPFSEIHFTQKVNFDLAPSTNRGNLYIYLGVAFMILLIALINYVNLATARAVNNTREVGIRKVIGASRPQLILRQLAESGIIVLMAMTIAVLSMTLFMPVFSGFIGKDLPLPFDQLLFWELLGTTGLFMTLLSGVYPAWFLSRFTPISALKGKTGEVRSNPVLRNLLVIFQFTISGTLILGAIVLSQQLAYIQSMDTGFSKDQILVMGIRDRGVRGQLDLFKEQLRTIAGVSHVSSSNSLPNNISSNGEARWPGRKPEESIILYTNTADASFVDLYDLELVAGRNFDPNVPGGEKAILLNESAVKALGWENPLERQLITWWSDTCRVVGVLKDFHQHSLHLDIEPIQIFQRTGQFNVSVKFEGGDAQRIIKEIEEKYLAFEPIYPFDYQYFDDVFNKAYETEMKAGQLAKWFTVLAIFIACLGLYGLVVHKVQHRIKEIGVRKVLGASVMQLLVLLSRDFTAMLLVSFVLAAPMAYFVMEGWLYGFAYHIQIKAWSFGLALLAMLVAAALTVSFRTYRSATSNPIKALRED